MFGIGRRLRGKKKQVQLPHALRVVEQDGAAAFGGPPDQRRMLADASNRAQAYLIAALEYPDRIAPEHLNWLYLKPFEFTGGHPGFFYLMHITLGILRAMKIPPGADVLEVGCGPGWLTEILAQLGYRVTALEPAANLLEIAKHRVNAAASHHRMEVIRERVTFVESSLEDFEVTPESFAAIIFFDVLHHTIDEEIVFRKCAEALRPDGVLGVIEGAWLPGDKAQEAGLWAEMEQFGTLENPFTQKYLDWMLHKHGFVGVERLMTVQGMVPTSYASRPLRDVALEAPAGRNDLIARRPAGKHPFSNNIEAKTDFACSILSSQRSSDGVRLRVRIENRGETILIGGADRSGAICLVLKSRRSPSDPLVERGSVLLPLSLMPGHSHDFDAHFPTDHSGDLLFIDMSINNVAWMSDRGVEMVALQ